MPETKSLEEYKRVFITVIKKDRQRSFFLHLTVYIIVNVVSAIINIVFTPQFLWIIFPVFFWGIGVIWNYFTSFVLFDKKMNELALKTEDLLKNNLETENDSSK